MKLNNALKNLNYNLKVYGPPELIDYNNLDNNFILSYDKNDIVNNAIEYFYHDPENWQLPAKNYFVRICLACYLSNNQREFYDLLNDNRILPYEDKYSKEYKIAKDIYDDVIYRVNLNLIKELPGYIKTIDIFSYLYDNPLHGHKITVGYNCTGQDFFDVISFYKSYIEEYYFSFKHTMPRAPLDLDNVYNQLKNSNQYNISSNLLLNTEQEELEWDNLIKKAYKCTDLKAVSVLTIKTAKLIKEKYPELKIHISTHGAQNINTQELVPELIYCVNLNEPDFFTEQQQNIIKKCRETKIKLKYITNRGCVFGKHKFMSALTNKDMLCCNKHQCNKTIEENPWINLVRTNLYKEQLKYLNFDFIKLSTRERNNEQINKMLKYWISPEIFTTHISSIPVINNKYSIFLDWRKQRFNCKGNCLTCNICKEYYEKLTN